MATKRHLQMAEQVLIAAWSLAPGRAHNVRAMDEESRRVTIASWAEAIAGMNVPDEAIGEAVFWWANNRAEKEMLSPQGIKEAARTVVGKWEQDPQKRAVLERRREIRREERDQRIGLIANGEHRALE